MYIARQKEPIYLFVLRLTSLFDMVILQRNVRPLGQSRALAPNRGSALSRPKNARDLPLGTIELVRWGKAILILIEDNGASLSSQEA